MLTPSQVARRAQVGVTTVRNWSTEYADLLSPKATGTDGPRLYNDEDVETICTIAALRSSGVPPAEVAERIRNKQVPPIVDVEPTPQPSHKATEAYQDAPTATFALQTVQSSLQQQINAIERHHASRIEAVERRQEAHDRMAIWWARLQGAIAGIVLLSALLFLIWLIVYARPWW